MQPKKFVRGKHQYTQWGKSTEVRTMTEQKNPQQPEGVQLQVEADDATAQGMYANLAGITHTETEFVLDFLFLQPAQPKAKLRSRIISSPLHTKRLLAALADNVRKFEARFGPIQESAAPPAPGLKH
ncbi:MAG: DUF3467 domain-containing protein [Elusimicrobiota bacterium]|jgi:hypothetical protein